MPCIASSRYVQTRTPRKKSKASGDLNEVSLETIETGTVVTSASLSLSTPRAKAGSSVTAQASSRGSGHPEYKFLLLSPDNQQRVACGFSSRATCTFVAPEQPGSWKVYLFARDISAGAEPSFYDVVTEAELIVEPAAAAPDPPLSGSSEIFTEDGPPVAQPRCAPPLFVSATERSRWIADNPLCPVPTDPFQPAKPNPPVTPTTTKPSWTERIPRPVRTGAIVLGGAAAAAGVIALGVVAVRRLRAPKGSSKSISKEPGKTAAKSKLAAKK